MHISKILITALFFILQVNKPLLASETTPSLGEVLKQAKAECKKTADNFQTKIDAWYASNYHDQKTTTLDCIRIDEKSKKIFKSANLIEDRLSEDIKNIALLYYHRCISVPFPKVCSFNASNNTYLTPIDGKIKDTIEYKIKKIFPGYEARIKSCKSNQRCEDISIECEYTIDKTFKKTCKLWDDCISAKGSSNCDGADRSKAKGIFAMVSGKYKRAQEKFQYCIKKYTKPVTCNEKDSIFSRFSKEYKVFQD